MSLRARWTQWRARFHGRPTNDSQKPQLICFPLRFSWQFGYFDFVEFEPAGVLRLVGWSRTALAAIAPPSVALNGTSLAFVKMYRLANGSVDAGPEALVAQSGLILEYRLPPVDGAALDIDNLAVGDRSLRIARTLFLAPPHYATLLDSPSALSRTAIYASGPPSPTADPSLIALVRRTRGRVLDFGCGSGALVDFLLRQQIDAYGLELEAIRDAVHEAVRDRVTFYDGHFPAPLADGSFDTVIASEVVEHIPDWKAAVAELARLSRSSLVITVPDSEAIPLGFRHRLVPWHMLEASHLTFFTQASLHAALQPHFQTIEFGRSGIMQMNETRYYESIVAVCTK